MNNFFNLKKNLMNNINNGMSKTVFKALSAIKKVGKISTGCSS